MRVIAMGIVGGAALAFVGCSSVVDNAVCSDLVGTKFNSKASACATGTIAVTETLPSQSQCNTDLSSCNAGDTTLLTSYATCLGALSTCSPGGSEETFVAGLETCNAGISGLTSGCAHALGFTFIGGSSSSSSSSGSSGGSSGSSSSSSGGSSGGSSGSSGLSGQEVCTALVGANFNGKVGGCATGAVEITETIPSLGTCESEIGSACNTGDQTLLTTYSACIGALGSCSPGEGLSTFVVQLDICNGDISGLSASCATAFSLRSSSSGSTGSTGSSGSSSSGSSGH